MKKYINALTTKLTTNIFEMVAVVALFALLIAVFDIDYVNLSLIIAGAFIVYVLERLSPHKIRNMSFLIFVIVFLGFFFFDAPINLISIILGMNLSALFLQMRNLKVKTVDISFINTIALGYILLASGIEKFRGVNKLNEMDIRLTIPVIILICYFIYLLSAYITQYWAKFGKKYKERLIFAGVIIATLSIAGLMAVYYKEIGADLMALPVLSGFAAFTYKKVKKDYTILDEVLDIVMLIMLPFQLSGFMGIGLAVLGFFAANYLLGHKINKVNTFDQLSIAKYSPLLFLFASQEIRENRGLINRLDITNGYQISWLLISLVVAKFASNNITKLMSWVKHNDIYKLFPQLVIIGILLGFAIIIRSGRFEGTVGITTAFASLMFFYANTNTEKMKPAMRFLNSAAGFIGAMSFIVLTTF